MPADEFFSAISDHGSPPVYYSYIAGKWITSESHQTITVNSPIDGKAVGTIQRVTQGEIDSAIATASKAQKEWMKVPMIKRSQTLHLVADWIREHEVYLTQLLIGEIGKTSAEAKDEIVRSADMISYFADEGLSLRGEELSGEAFPGYDQTKMAIIERVPVGVVLAIAPFNYPVNLSVSKIAPALITGNAVIFKPATQGAISGLHLIEIFRKAGLPEGLISTVTGGGNDIGDYLVTHPKINMITFTGSSRVGKHIAEKAGMIPMQFECGGNNPALVLQDADMDATATEIMKGAFSYSGQRCTAIKYVLGLAPTLDQIIPKLIEKTQKEMKLGDPRTEGINMGPVVSDEAAGEIENRILKAKAEGAIIAYGGHQNGRLIEPTILTNAKLSMDIIHTETFGPIVCFITVKSIDEAIDLMNASDYGLQASIFTSDEGSGIRIGKQIDVGSVQVNSKPQRGPDHFPFLGIKGSGVGVQGIRYSLEAMTRFRSIVLNKPQ